MGRRAADRTAHRHKERVVERESDIQNFAGVAGVALALAALGKKLFSMSNKRLTRIVLFARLDTSILFLE